MHENVFPRLPAPGGLRAGRQIFGATRCPTARGDTCPPGCFPQVLSTLSTPSTPSAPPTLSTLSHGTWGHVPSRLFSRGAHRGVKASALPRHVGTRALPVVFPGELSTPSTPSTLSTLSPLSMPAVSAGFR
jgi:hypothetical protein